MCRFLCVCVCLFTGVQRVPLRGWHRLHLKLLVCHVANEYIENNLHNKLGLQEHKRKKRSTWHSATNSWHSVQLYILILCEHISLHIAVITALPWSCAQGPHTFFWQNGTRRQQIMWLVHVWLDYQLSFMISEYLRSHLAHSSPHIRRSLDSSADPFGGRAAGIPKLFQEFSSVRTVRDGTCVWLSMWDIWGTATG